MRIQERLFLLLALLILSVPAHASPWYPIDTGRLWIYNAASGGTVNSIVGATETFAGALVQPLEWNSGNREYFSEDGSGRVFQHGVSHPNGDYVVFDPPFLRMDSELTPGHEWESVVEVVYYDGDHVEVQRLESHLSYQVVGSGLVEVEAGVFEAVEVLVTEQREPVPPLTKRVVTSFREHYAEGVGWILRTDETGNSMIFELEAYGEAGVSNDTSSWGALKAQYEE